MSRARVGSKVARSVAESLSFTDADEAGWFAMALLEMLDAMLGFKRDSSWK